MMLKNHLFLILVFLFLTTIVVVKSIYINNNNQYNNNDENNDKNTPNHINNLHKNNNKDKLKKLNNKNQKLYNSNHKLININNNKDNDDVENNFYNNNHKHNNLNTFDYLDLDTENIKSNNKLNNNNIYNNKNNKINNNIDNNIHFNINSNKKKQNLKFNSKNKFKIIQFTDLHFGEGENTSWGSEQDINSTRVMNAILDKEYPVDLVIFTGDLITGNNIIDNATYYWMKAVGVVKERNIPWAITFGNHDDLASGLNGTREDLMKFDIDLGSYSKFGQTDIPGVSNYYLEIYDRDDKYPISMIWIFDSGNVGKTCNTSILESYNSQKYQCNRYITKEQINWYSNETKYLKQTHKFDKVLWSGAFFHIPLQEYMLLWNYDTCHGYNNDSIACQPVNDGVLNEFVNNGDISFISVGHNHGNDFCGTLDEIKMCYGRHSGYGGYGNWERGARVIELSISKFSNKIHLNTWITFETGQQLFNQIQHRPSNNTIPQTKCTDQL